jgi:hypothetical protein
MNDDRKELDSFKMHVHQFSCMKQTKFGDEQISSIMNEKQMFIWIHHIHELVTSIAI